MRFAFRALCALVAATGLLTLPPAARATVTVQLEAIDPDGVMRVTGDNAADGVDVENLGGLIRVQVPDAAADGLAQYGQLSDSTDDTVSVNVPAMGPGARRSVKVKLPRKLARAVRNAGRRGVKAKLDGRRITLRQHGAAR